MGCIDEHCFYIKDLNQLAKLWECKDCYQRFSDHSNFNRHIDSCNGGQTKVICQGKKIKEIMSSSKKVFYGGNTQFSYG